MRGNGGPEPGKEKVNMPEVMVDIEFCRTQLTRSEDGANND